MLRRGLWVAAILAGLWLRTAALDQMEYKEDEEYNFAWSQMIGHSKPWPMWGMPSGVYVPNPGMSVWTFAGLAKISGANDPVALMRALAIFAVLGILVCARLGRFSRDPSVWEWAGALALVNPVQIMYQRKLWPEPFLPFFVALTLAGWWLRTDAGWRGFVAAATWGLIGAWLGQIHMSGFFIAAALVAVTAFTDWREKRRLEWFGAWFLGSVIGALPLIPWAIYAFKLPAHPNVSGGLGEMLQLKYWMFFLSNPWGLHVGNSLGLLRGSSHWAQLSDFARYPLIAGQASWIVGGVHAAILALLAMTLTKLALGWRRLAIPTAEKRLVFGFAILAGILMTIPAVSIRRYYLMVAFPLETIVLVYFVRAAFPTMRTRVLASLWICQLVISAAFVQYVSVNEGSPQGDYGKGYAREMQSRVPYGPQPR